MEIVDRSRVAYRPALVGPADWHTTVNDSDEAPKARTAPATGSTRAILR